MELAVMWIICLGQFAVIAWLAYPRLKPKALDVWAKADETLKRLNRTDAENWQIDFDRAAGIEPKAAAGPSAHELVNVRIATTGAFVGWLQFECSCGKHKDREPSEWSMNDNMKLHRSNVAAVERLSK